ncbi:MAG: sodium-dependent transporter [Gammaproteobacteria bacterium]|nr:sodium-dependent transporter [Gammaproteobacteria bacterium]MCY4281741.1 sodium-dependent transporter [Gammaproteobacteria bacterium]MCY4339539.1 sodium-dependent transporter [Gammaproteobacteria bacterium]
MTQAGAREQWSSRSGFILAAIGGAIGLGNIWKFPYMAGSSGGGAFVIVYLVAVALVAVPILVAELMLGRHGGHSPPTAMRINAELEHRSRCWSGVGWIGAGAGFLILSFYAVIGGWVLDYVFVSVSAGFSGVGADAAQARFAGLLSAPVRLLLWFTVFLGLTGVIVSAGLRNGIERAAGILMPMLFAMLLALTLYSAVAGDMAAGLRFLFAVDFNKINPAVMLAAVGHAFFSVGVSMGLMMAYGSYLPREVSIPRTALVIAGADTLVAIIAGIAIFPLVFANGLQPGAGPGLIFVTLPIAFGNMPAGGLFGAVFFTLLLLAALTSAIAILEPAVAWIEERRGMTRRRAAALTVAALWLLGLGSVLSFNRWDEVKPVAGMNIFDLLDYLTANLMMPIGGMLIAIFAGWFMRAGTLAQELHINTPWLFHGWRFLIKTVTPLAIAAILVTNVWLK